MKRHIAHFDSRGILLREGQRVAYNRSGDVIEGEVLDVSCPSHIKIMPHPDFRRPTASVLYSKVKRGYAILVIS